MTFNAKQTSKAALSSAFNILAGKRGGSTAIHGWVAVASAGLAGLAFAAAAPVTGAALAVLTAVNVRNAHISAQMSGKNGPSA